MNGLERDGGMPAWLPQNTRLYLSHIEDGKSIRAIAREEGCHASTVLRRIRACENRRDDPLVDDALTALGRAATGPTHTSPSRYRHAARRQSPQEEPRR